MDARMDSVWERFSAPLRRFILRRVADTHDAEDILQDVFVKILRHTGDMESRDKIHAWVYAIARNAITDYYRKSRRHRTEALPEEIKADTDMELDDREEIASCLYAMLDHMPEKYRQAVEMVEFQNMSQKEYGEKMGLSVSGAKSRVQRARKMLLDMLTACCDFERDRRGHVMDYTRKDPDTCGCDQ